MNNIFLIEISCLCFYRDKKKNSVSVKSSPSIEVESDEQTENTPPQDCPSPLTEDEKKLIKSTWSQIEKDAEKVGPMTFVKYVCLKILINII